MSEFANVVSPATAARAIAVAVLAAAVWAIPAGGASAEPRTADPSRITKVTINTTQDVGTFNGAAYVRMVGTVEGVVAASEPVVGLTGDLSYAAQFELITAAPGQPSSDGVIVEAENRGSPFVFDSVQNLGLLTGPPSTIVYPAGLGNGFLQNSGLAWARVQWQGPNGTAPVINPTVPVTAQGVGQVIMRDFGLLLRGFSGRGDGPARELARVGLPTYRTAILVGVSQSAWFVNTFVAEGFNVPPHGRGLLHRTGRVFDGAYAQNGVGNWLAINQLNQARGFTAQSPYVQPDGVPLTPLGVLHRPLSDPFFVDTTAYTDYYRIRASLFNRSLLAWNLREYNVPNAHSAGASLPLFTTPTRVGCPAGAATIPAVNPLDGRPYTRAFILGLARRVGIHGLRADAPLLPPSHRFALTEAPEPSTLFNDLPGVTLKVPVVNDANQPVGGHVRYPEVELPLGAASPVSLPPVGTLSITDTCGNFGGWQPFTAATLAQRYGDVDSYLARYEPLLDTLIAHGRVLASDRESILTFTRRLYLAAPAQPGS